MKNVSKFRRWLIEKLGGHIDMPLADVKENERIAICERRIRVISAVVEVDARFAFDSPINASVKNELSRTIADFIKQEELWSITHSVAPITGNPLIKATVYIAKEANDE